GGVGASRRGDGRRYGTVGRRILSRALPGARPGRDLPRRARSSDRGRPATVRRFGAGTAAQPRSAGGTGSAGGAPRARTFLLAIAGRAGATVDYWAYRPARRCRRRIPADCRDRSGDGDGIGLGPCPHDPDPATG